MTKTYVFLAFNEAMSKRGVPNPLGDQWLRQWLSSVMDLDEFNEVHGFMKLFYTDFGSKVDKLKASLGSLTPT